MDPRPILFIYAESEAKYGIEQFDMANEPKTLWIVPASAHGLNYGSAPEQYEQKILDFLQQYLFEDPAEN